MPIKITPLYLMQIYDLYCTCCIVLLNNIIGSRIKLPNFYILFYMQMSDGGSKDF